MIMICSDKTRLKYEFSVLTLTPATALVKRSSHQWFHNVVETCTTCRAPYFLRLNFWKHKNALATYFRLLFGYNFTNISLRNQHLTMYIKLVIVGLLSIFYKSLL